MERYRTYKDSGVEWIGKIPEHWEIIKLKYIGDSIIGCTYSPSEIVPKNGTLVLRSSNIQNGMLDLDDCVFIDKEIPDKLRLKTGDILICSRNGSRSLIGKNITIDETTEGATFGAFMTVFRTKATDFVSKYFNSQVFSGQSGLFLTATINQLTINTINNFYIALPSFEEQKAIASYLDQKTAEIDQLIAQKERLIELYEEEKSAIINQAVTKGIDPNVKLKPSGIDWLGDIPEHWHVTKLKYLIKALESGVSVNSRDVPVSEESYGILKTSCVYNYIFDPTENKEILTSELSRAKVNPRKGELIISRMNTPELVGASGYVDRNYTHLFLPDRLWQTVFFDHVNINKKWLSFLLKASSFRGLLSTVSTGTSSSMKNIGQESFLDIEVPFPDPTEQGYIVKYIETELDRIVAKIAKTKRIIELQKEYRTALISEAVTGKIKVPSLVKEEV